MKIAKLNKRITFQRKTQVQDEEGNWVEGYEDAFTVWGAIEGVSSMRNPEVTIAGARGIQAPRKIIIRENKQLKRDMRATCDGRIFDVLDFDYAKNSKAYFEIICNEVDING
ncbi:phage head closure protein [Geobacillus stearothermophilus]|uniref:phage head closure protein n=1 Tax=Geobacillus stearothermophilus TaxID=1422 RepID=UPI001EEDCB7C|nr:phage head closure protein [Geobacillus stearothermophilus]MCK7604856.1 phage head closure protein [Geobacillus stearothermophilus]